MGPDRTEDFVYQGDTVLAGLLAEAGARLDVSQARRLIAGLLAAPEPRDPNAWMRLVAEHPGLSLSTQLLALRRELAATLPAPGPALADRLPALRADLAARGLDGFVLPRGDEHQNEYVPRRAERLAWLTGFTGSAGAAVVLTKRAAVFVDGRYTLQAAAEVDAASFEIRHLVEEPPSDWLAQALAPGAKVGYDPWLHTPDGVARLKASVEKAGASLVALADNPIDRLWTDQPPQPLAPIRPHELAFAGVPSSQKRRQIAAEVKRGGADAVVLGAPDSIAWLLNIRGGDVPHAPLPLAFAILSTEGTVELFVDRLKLPAAIAGHLGNAVSIAAPEELGPALDRLGRSHARVMADPAALAAWIFERLAAAGAETVRATDPCQLPKACKNDVELENCRIAHRRDGAALVRFLAWLDAEAPRGQLTEIDAADRLAALRAEGEHFLDLSFPTISGAGANGAIVHYRVSPATNRRLAPDMLYLVDSGGQYRDATTDVTRTIAIGTPSPEQRDRFTRVLQGHIRLARARFPEGTSGTQLDALARLALWEAGLDYDHGTGHGVGSYLSVHEGPQRISKLPNTVPLKPGMIVSDEPGYYKTGAYGIRIENLVAVTRVEAPPGAERKLLGFETLTLAPIDRRLIEATLLSPEERAWVDAYHARVQAEIAPLVDAATRAWLDAATQPL